MSDDVEPVLVTGGERLPKGGEGAVESLALGRKGRGFLRGD